MVDSLNFIYHASYTKVEYPAVKKSKFTKDFSWGFYCNTSKDEAEKHAAIFITPNINVYRINISDSLNVKVFEDYNVEWLDFIIRCRDGKIHGYDIVIGPIADDSVYDYMDAYYAGQMNEVEFFEEMKLKYKSKQISFHTIKALDSIQFVESYTVG